MKKDATENLDEQLDRAISYKDVPLFLIELLIINSIVFGKLNKMVKTINIKHR